VLLAPPGGFAAHACTPAAASARLRGFFRVWTLKEAYTKALGAGVGFDFARLDLDLGATTPVLRVDGALVVGWALAAWEVNVRGETYMGALARFVGPGPTSAEEDATVRDIPLPPAWEHGSASMFVGRALESLEVKSITASRKDIKRDA
jgi:4'-phosphopantetheinyl transferase